MNNAYVRELLTDYSRNPQNYGTIADPDLSERVENPQCVGPTHPEGDWISISLIVSDNEQHVIDSVRFEGAGCTLSQAPTSLLTQQMKWTEIEEVRNWDREFIEQQVGMDLTPARLQCAELVVRAVRQGEYK
mgnify:FL=1